MSTINRGRRVNHQPGYDTERALPPDENFLHVFKGGPLCGPPGAPVGKRARLRLFGRSGPAPPRAPEGPAE
jgi:hypothetical protein